MVLTLIHFGGNEKIETTVISSDGATAPCANPIECYKFPSKNVRMAAFALGLLGL